MIIANDGVQAGMTTTKKNRVEGMFLTLGYRYCIDLIICLRISRRLLVRPELYTPCRVTSSPANV